MKLLLAAIVATTAASAFAQNTKLPPPVPSEVISIHGQVPPVPSEVMSIQGQIPPIPTGNINAYTGQFGTVTGSSLSNIGNTLPTHTAPAIPAINMPRIR